MDSRPSLEIDMKELSPTQNKEFDSNGYVVVKRLCDPAELFSTVPDFKGVYRYTGKKEEDRIYIEHDPQVKGATARYWHPQYKSLHTKIRHKLEVLLGRKLYNTYYYDRFYYPGQELKRHKDRSACEISVSVHCSTNLSAENARWPFWIDTPSEERPVVLQAGDGLIYKGCEREHWREPMPREYRKRWFKKPVEIEGLYYHQIFFHYVLADGHYAHCAGDKAY